MARWFVLLPLLAACGSTPSPEHHAFAVMTDCASCHLDRWKASEQPPHSALDLPKACGDCHTTAGWPGASFDIHDQFFVLDGRHTSLDCKDCHVGGQYTGTAAECFACHAAAYEGADDHQDRGYPHGCGRCHKTSGWEPPTWKGHGWPLTGKHAKTKCSACHENEVWEGTPSTCAGCHLPDYQGAADPDHVAAGFPQTCEVCHGTSAWEPATYSGHDDVWPLLGKHQTAPCASCHTGGVYSGTPRECKGCHLPDYQGAKDPDHVTAGYPTSCEVCHTPAAWKPASFDGHDTYWPLTGKHEAAACGSCHAGGVYAGTPRECKGCHLPDYSGAKDPDHVAAAFPQTCGTCHSTAAWEPASFDGHDAYWALTGKHKATECGSCHVGGVYAGTPRECKGCHLPDYSGAKNPDHVASGLPQSCDICHSTAAWEPASYEGHDAYWPLTGKHKATECASCHAGGVYAGTPKQCKGCHLPDYSGAKDPDHVASGFPQTCDSCHSTAAWEPAAFADHDAYWALTGKHKTTSCASCHVGGVYAGTPKQCQGCHLPDFTGTKDPDHVASGFPKTCDTCHTTTAWEPASFGDHDAFWPLTGKHQTTSCASCHAGGVYAGTPKQCQGCHTPDWTAAADPSHSQLALPKTCETCHTTSGWATTKFPGHDTLFPITSGKHKFSCASCHKGATWSVFTCVGCHALSQMNAKHLGEVGNYQATLNAAPTVDHGCLKCHPKGDD